MLGRRQDALNHLQNALLLKPTDAEVSYFAALVYAQIGKDDDALTSLRRAVARGYSRAEIDRTPEFDRLRDSLEFRKLLTPQGS
jgi:tetratricopeptide (TPR) repeat protein